MVEQLSNNTAVGEIGGEGFIFVVESAERLAQKDVSSKREGTTNAEVVNEICLWGADNLRPQNMAAAARQNDVLLNALQTKINAAASQRLGFGLLEGYDNDGPIYTPTDKKTTREVLQFMRVSNISRYIYEAVSSIFFYNNAWVSLIKGKETKQIAKIEALRPEYCRWAYNPNGEPNTVIHTANWDKYPTSVKSDKSAVRLKALDTYYDAAGQFIESTQDLMVYPLTPYTPDSPYYARANWESVWQNGWLELSNEIPTSKLKVFKNGLNVRWRIRIPNYYFPNRFGAEVWEKKTPTERWTAMQGVFKEFEDALTNKGDKAGGGLWELADVGTDGKLKEGWLIEPVKIEISDGWYREDGLTANEHIHHAVGISSALTGNVPGKGGMGAGSGSDVREHMNLFFQLNTPTESLILEPLGVVRDVNKWPENLEFFFYKANLQTLNQVTPAKR